MQQIGHFLKTLKIIILDKVQKKIIRPVNEKNVFQYFASKLQNFCPKFQKVQREPPKKIFLKKVKKGIKKRRILC